MDGFGLCTAILPFFFSFFLYRYVGLCGILYVNVFRLSTASRGASDLFSIFTSPASQVLFRYFESEPLRSTLASDAVIGAMARHHISRGEFAQFFFFFFFARSPSFLFFLFIFFIIIFYFLFFFLGGVL